MAGKPRGGKRKQWKRKPRARKFPLTNVNRALQPLAQRYICKMKYAESFDIPIPMTGFVGTYRYNLNSIFDPNRTGVGHQPYGRDTLSTIYNRYRVISCHYKVCISQLVASSEPLQLAVLPANEEVSIGLGAEARESPRAKYIVQAGNGAPIRMLTGKVSIPALVGRTKAQYMADDRYQATYDANPVEAAVLNIFVSLLNDGQVVSERPVKASIELVYTVESFDPKQLAQS